MAAAAILILREMSITVECGLDTDMYTNVYGKTHHGHTEMTS